MGAHLSGAGLGAGLALTAAASSLATGVSLSHGGVLVLLLSVLIASRWCGRAAGYAAILTGAAFSLVLFAASGAPASGADAAALVLLAVIGSGIAAWTGPRSPATHPPPADARRLKEEFLATVSHELRTPLNAILGWTELLRTRRAVPPQQVDRGLEVIERNARRQLALVEELLSAAEPETSADDWRPLDMRGLLDTLLESLEPAASAAEVRLTMDEPEPATAVPGTPAPIWVRGDAASLRLALRHVVENAIKFTPARGEVRTRLRQCGDRVLIFVCDTGGGIEAPQLEQMFEPFRQGDGSAVRRFGGLGLGLTIARKLIERHGGHIDLRSDGSPGGSTVLVTLPRASSPDADAEPPLGHP
jgi:signal transduction histidine kinase